IDIATQPGLGPLRGGMDVTFRDDALNARNAFQSEKGPERTQQYNVNLSGTIFRDRTSFSLAAGGASLYDAANIYAAVPGSTLLSAVVRRPSDRMNVNLRVDHAINRSHTLRGSFQQNNGTQHNLGMGGYDLDERAYMRTANERIWRVAESGPLARNWFAESRGQVRRVDAGTRSSFEIPTV